MTTALIRDFPIVDEDTGAPLALGPRERDFLLLNVFVLLQQGYAGRAALLADAMAAAGDGTPEVRLARAVLRFAERDFAAALLSLEELDHIDPIERFGTYKLNERQRMRRYLKTRCLFELGDTARVRDALETYLRHGTQAGEADE